MTLINLGFKGLDHAHLPLEVLRKLVIIHDVSVTLPLEHTQLRNNVVPIFVDISDTQLRIPVLISLHIELQLQVTVDLVVLLFAVFEQTCQTTDFGIANFEFLTQVAAVSVNSVEFLEDEVESSLKRIVIVL